jgi:glycosyltransferase A (GT-A) superfamily protein (DUF2064 family)
LLKVAQHKTAVLIFANSSGIDEVRKGIPNSKKLFHSLTADILNKVQKTQLPYFICNEELQLGADFGARFTTAIKSVFAKGFDSIITVGNDTPHLTTSTILSAYENLQQGKTVIGPSVDGGVYLLGVHKNRFDASAFRELPWQQRNLFEKIAICFMRRGMLHQLPRLADIDSIKDAKTILDKGTPISSELVFVLIKLLRIKKAAKEYFLNTSHFTYSKSQFNKGSPRQLQSL